MPKAPTKTSLTTRLDKVARELCFIRAGYRCQRCKLPWNGKKWPHTNLEWAHIERRSSKAIRWNMENCLALCNRNGNQCHKWFDRAQTVAVTWLVKEYPEKVAWLTKEIGGIPRAHRNYSDTIEERIALEQKLKEEINANATETSDGVS